MEDIEVKRVKRKLDRLQDVIVDLTAQLRFFRRENNLLKAKLLQWEKGEKRNYKSLKVRRIMAKHRDEDWKTIKNSEVNIDLNRW